MKTNIFKVREKRKKQIIIEEETIKNPLLLFLKKNKRSIIMSLMMILVCLILVSIGLAFSLFRGGNDYDITYITGGEEIGTNNDPTVDDEDIEDELLGEIAREDGVVILVKSVMTPSGDVISYFTDGTAIMVTSKGKTYRISTNDKGKYGINEKGKVDATAVRVLVESSTSTLNNGTVITYYSDGTAKVELRQETIFVRDSNNIAIDESNTFDRVNPSGVALSEERTRINRGIANIFSDGTALVTIGNKSLLINKNTKPEIVDGNITYDDNNVFSVVAEKKYSDGNNITHYSNGSATITDKNGNVIYVKRSGDLVLKNKELYEIMPNDKGFSRWTIRCSNGERVVYFDNGAAIIIYPNNDRQYIEDSDDIIYDGNNRISKDIELESSKLVSIMLDDEGRKVYSFDNGKSQVISSDNSSYIVDTDTLKLTPIVDEDEKDPEKDDNKDEGTSHPTINQGEGIIITEAESKYNDFKNIQNTIFVIKNKNTKNKNLRIVIEEVSDYRQYSTSRLDPRYVKFQATVGDEYVSATALNKNTWIDSDGVTNYIIYDGILRSKSTVNVALSLYVDYSLLNNSHQNKGFVGTIKIYVDG